VTYTDFEHLVVERRGHVGWLINNRPEQLNAMNAAMRDEFAVAWKELDADPEVRVIVHTGEGRAFQTGVDVAEIATDGVGMERYRESVADFDLHFTSWHQQVWKPVITAVNGICCGGGFHWVADADIVIAASDAQFFDPHVSIGQVVAIEAIGLMRKMPVEAVMRMAFMGRYERMGAAALNRGDYEQAESSFRTVTETSPAMPGALDNLASALLPWRTRLSFGLALHIHTHAVWGVAHLGAVLGEPRYSRRASRIWF